MEIDKYIPTLLTIVLIVTGADASTNQDADTGGNTGGNKDAISDFSCNPLGHMTMKVPTWVHDVTVICNTTQSQGSIPATQSSGSIQTSQQLTPTSKIGAPTLNNRNVTITNCTKGQKATLIMYAQSVSTTTTSHVRSSKQQSSSTTTSSQVISLEQKSAQVTLICTATPEKKWTGTVQFSIQGPTLTPVSAPETIGTLSIELRKSTTPFSPATEVSLGDKYILIISGEEPYDKKVTSCKASKTNNLQSGIEVFGNTVNALNNDTIKANLKSSHTVEHNAHDALLSMTGFRLVGSTTVYLQCTLDICKSNCTNAISENKEHSTRKRKKSSTPSKLRYATMKFEVKDKMLTPSSSGIKGIHSMTGSFVLLFTVTVLGYQTI